MYTVYKKLPSKIVFQATALQVYLVLHTVYNVCLCDGNTP